MCSNIYHLEPIDMQVNILLELTLLQCHWLKNNEPSIIFSLQNYNTEYTAGLPSSGKLLYTANHLTYHVKIEI